MASDIEALLSGAEEETAAEVDRLLAEMSKEILAELDAADEIVAARFRLSSISAMWKAKVPRLMRRLFRVAEQAADTAQTDTGGTLPEGWNDLPARFDDGTLPAALDTYEGATRLLLDAVGDHMAEAAIRSLNEGLAAGEGTEELRVRLAALFAPDGSELGPARSALISTTEATRAWNAATLAAAQEMTGLDRPLVKSWKSQEDNRVRETHAHADEQIQLLDDAFNVGSSELQYPGDPSAPADETCNCRCYLILTAAPQSLSASAEPHPGGMIALVPSADDVARLVIDGGEAADELHCTLFFLAEDASTWTQEQRDGLVRSVEAYVRSAAPVQARLFGVNHWNPGEDGVWVWPVGDAEQGSNALDRLRNTVATALEETPHPDIPVQYSPVAYHVTAGYRQDDGLMAPMTERLGPVTFDRLRIVFAGDVTDVPLTGDGLTAAAASGGYGVGDRVRVSGAPHEQGHASGTVTEVHEGPAYAITFDGTDTPHKWYVADELSPGDDETMPDSEMAADGADPSYFPVRTWATPGDAALAFEDEQTGDGRFMDPGSLYWDSGPWPLQYCDSMGMGHDGAELAGAIQSMERDERRITGEGVLYLTQDAGWEVAMLLDQGAPLGVSADLDDVDIEVVQSGGEDGGPPGTLAPDGEFTRRARIGRLSVLRLPDGAWSLTASASAVTASGTGLVDTRGHVTVVTGIDGRLTASMVEELTFGAITAAAGDPSPDGTVIMTEKSGDMTARITRARIRGATLVPIPAYAKARIVIDPEETGLLDAEPVEVQEDMGLAASADDVYAIVIAFVRSSTQPLNVRTIAQTLGLKPSDVRRHLRRAVEENAVVKLSRTLYTAATEDLSAAASGKTDLPVAPRDTTWDGSAAAESVFGWGSDAEGNLDPAKVQNAFFWYDSEAPELKGSYKLGFARVQDGALEMVPEGVFAAAAAVQGARGGVDIPEADMDAVKGKISAAYATISKALDEEHVAPWDAMSEDGGEGEFAALEELEASVWTAMRDTDPMPAAWFQEPTAEELPPGSGGVHYKDGRVFGWVAQSGVPHAAHGPKITIDKIAAEGLDTSHFLRAKFTLDDGTVVRAGAFTMNVGHHRDGFECETAACQFDDSRTVGGIVTVGLNEGGLWFSGAASPWMSEWDLNVFKATQPSYHLVRGRDSKWQLRGILSVPVPGHSSPLTAAAVIDRTNLALTASAMAVTDREATVTAAVTEDSGNALTSVTAVTEAVTAAISSPSFLDSLAAAMDRRAEQKAGMADTLASLAARVGGNVVSKDTKEGA